MNTRIDPSILMNKPDLTNRSQLQNAFEGEYKGQKVFTKNSGAIFANAAEELTFASSEKLEKKLSKRKIGGRADSRSRMLEKAEFYLKRLPDLKDAEQLKKFAQHLKKQANLTPQQALSEAKKFFKDVSHQHAALSFSKEMQDEAGGSSQLKDVLSKAMGQCEKDHGPEIRAGMNVSQTATRFSKEGLGEIGRLRDFYRDVILSQKEATLIFHSIKKHFKGEAFKRAAQFLIKALGRDLQSMGPSVSHEELKTILDNLYLLESLKNTDDACIQLMKKLARQNCISGEDCSKELTGGILDLKKEQWLKSDQVINMAKDMGLVGDTEKNIECQINFLREIREIVRQMPIKLFTNLDDREKLLNAMQEALDISIDNEEEMLS